MFLVLSIFTITCTAYTIENEPNLNRNYTWKWNQGVTSVQSYFWDNHPASPVKQRNMLIRAGMNGYGINVNQNGGVNYSSLSAYDTETVDSSDQNLIVIYAALSKPLSTGEYNTVQCTISTGKDDYLLISHDFTFVVDFITCGYGPGDEPGYSPILSEAGELHLYLGSTLKYTLLMNYQSVEPIPNSNLYKYSCFFTLDNSEGVDVEFDRIDAVIPCVVMLGAGREVTDGRDSYWEPVYYSRYRISVADAKLYETADPTTVSIYEGVNAANMQFLKELNTVSSAEQEKIDEDILANIWRDGIYEAFRGYEEQIFGSFTEFDFYLHETVQISTDHAQDLWDVFFADSDFYFHVFLHDVVMFVIVIAGASILIYGVGGVTTALIRKIK